MDVHEQKALDDIEKHGCHILQVMEEGELPPFSYSIGLGSTYEKPDLCVIGLKEPMAKFVINEYALMLRDGIDITSGNMYSGLLEGFDVCFERVARKYFKEYFGWSIWYNKGRNFEMLQLIYPTTSGLYPWDTNFPTDLFEWQPILSDDGETAFHRK